MLDELAALGPFFAVAAHRPGATPAPPWRPLSELAAPSRALRERIASVRAILAGRGGVAAALVEPRVAASAVHLGLAARLAAPALGAAVLGHPLDPRPGDLWWQDAPGGPVPLSVPLAASPGAPPAQAVSLPVEDPPPASAGPARPPRPPGGPWEDPGPPGEWDLLLLDELLAPLTAAVAQLVPVSRRVLWGNVASAVNAAAAQVARQRPDLAADAWRAAARLFARPRLGDERNPPGPAFRRSSCCLFYRLAPGTPSSVCGDCVLAGRASSR